jgi:SAM-dependent methyltransferase
MTAPTLSITNLLSTLLLAAGALLPASLLAMEEVPFVTTPDNVTLEMLRIAEVGPGDHVIDLGSGDGRIVILAAKRFGARGLGVEIVPELVQQSIDNAKRTGVEARTEFRAQDIFKTDLGPATVVTLYLLPDVNLALRPAILSLKPGTRIVSHDWDMGDWKPERTVVVPAPEKKVGREKISRVHLWVVPANVDGLWCGLGRMRGTSLRFEQTFQRFAAVLAGTGPTRQFSGRIEGPSLSLSSTDSAALDIALKLEGEHLRVTQAGGQSSALQQSAFARSAGDKCLNGQSVSRYSRH